MRLKYEIDQRGLKQLDSRLKQLNQIGAAGNTAAMLAGANIIVGLARAKAPVRTGFLRSSIKAAVNAAGVQISAAAPYASYVEFGTARMSARPFFRPAFDEGYRPALQAIASEMRRQIAKAAK